MTEANNGTVKVEYTYDVFGNRIGRRVTTGLSVSEEHYAVDGWDTAKPGATGSENFDVWADLDANNHLVTRRVFGAGFDDLIARVDGDVVSWYGQDQVGSVRLVFDNSGNIIGSADYSAFGKQSILSGVLDRYGYTGREYDNVLSLQYSRARMYDPSSGRFLGEDPMGFSAGDANLNRYAGNAAMSGRDRRGPGVPTADDSGGGQDQPTPPAAN